MKDNKIEDTDSIEKFLEEDWNEADETDYSSLIERLCNKEVIKSENIEIIPHIFGDYWGIFFDIKSEFGTSCIELPFYEGQINDLLLWLENIVLDKYCHSLIKLNCDGYWKHYLAYESLISRRINNKSFQKSCDEVNVFHITDSIYGGVYDEKVKNYCQRQIYPSTVSYDEFEPFVARNFFTVKRKEFVRKFYKAYTQIVNIDILKFPKNNLFKDEVSKIKKSSSLIENYIK